MTAHLDGSYKIDPFTRGFHDSEETQVDHDALREKHGNPTDKSNIPQPSTEVAAALARARKNVAAHIENTEWPARDSIPVSKHFDTEC